MLRDGGALAVWWNNTDARDQPWWRAQQAELERLVDGYARHYRAFDPTEGLRLAFDSVTATEVPWVRTLDVEAYVVFLASKSYVAGIGEGMRGFLDRQRAVLLDAFPDGTVVEPYVTRLWVAR